MTWTYSLTPRHEGSDQWFYITQDDAPHVEYFRDWDGNRMWGSREEMQEITDHLNHGPLVLEVHSCDQRRSYTVTWEGTDE